MSASCWKHNGTADVYKYVLMGYRPVRWEYGESLQDAILVMKNTNGYYDIIYITWWGLMMAVSAELRSLYICLLKRGDYIASCDRRGNRVDIVMNPRERPTWKTGPVQNYHIRLEPVVTRSKI